MRNTSAYSRRVGFAREREEEGVWFNHLARGLHCRKIPPYNNPVVQCTPLKGKIAVHLRCSKKESEETETEHVRALILSKNCFATGVSTSSPLRDTFQYSSCVHRSLYFSRILSLLPSPLSPFPSRILRNEDRICLDGQASEFDERAWEERPSSSVRICFFLGWRSVWNGEGERRCDWRVVLLGIVLFL